MPQRDPIGSARRRYIASYILVSLLPLLLCAGFILMVNHQNNRSQIEQTMRAELELVKTRLDLMLKNLESAGMHFASSSVWKEHHLGGSAKPITDQLAAYREANPAIEEAAFLPTGQPYIFTTERRWAYGDFSWQMGHLFRLELSSFFTRMNVATTPMLLPTHRNTQRYVDGGWVIFVQPILPMEVRRQGSIAFFLKSQTLCDVFEESFANLDGLYYVLDQSMGVIYTSEGGEQADTIRERMNRLRGTGLFHQAVGGKDYVMLRAISDGMGTYYMAAIPADRFYEDAGYLLGNQVVVLSVALALVASFAVLLALMFYRPLERLLRRIASGQGTLSNRHTRLLQDAGLHVQQIWADRDALSEQVDRQRSLLLRQLVSGLLQGQLQETGLSILLEQLRLTWTGNRFLALHAWFSENAAFKAPVEVWRLPEGAVYGVTLEHGGQLALLADVTLAAEGDADALRRQVGRQCVRILEEQGRPALRLGAGLLKVSCMEAAASSLEAQSMGLDPEGGDASVLALYTPSTGGTLSDSFLPLAEKGLLCRCMESGNAELAAHTVEALRGSLAPFSSNRVLMRSVFFYLYDAVVTSSDAMQLGMDRAALNTGIATGSLDSFMTTLRHFCNEACLRVNRRRSQSALYTQHGIVQYVHEHYREYTLSLDELCREFNLSASYLSRFFNQETGMSFLRYVGRLRMELVKQQLTQTQTPIKDIVRAAGYLDVASFTRKFRNEVGMTPGEYRERYAKAAQN